MVKAVLRPFYRPLADRWPTATARLRHLLSGTAGGGTGLGDPAPGSPAALRMASWIDALWCDIHGVHVQGWAHAFEHPVRRIVFHCNGQRVETDRFLSRPDLLNHYPEHTHVADTGFSAYLPFPPFQPIRLELVTDAGLVSEELAVPGHLKAPPAEAAGPEQEPFERFLTTMRERRGTVLEIGARKVGDMTQSTAARLGPDCRFIGFDIHPAPGVDLVGDAHALSRLAGRGSVDGIMSIAVLEHLQAPWVVAAEINRTLRPGGLTFQVVPQTWPMHELPNDFWRMSDEGLKVLFGPALGFEILACGLADPFTIVPGPDRRIGSWTTMPLSPGFGTAFILARKVAEIGDAAVVWPAAVGDLSERSQAYPRHDA